LIFEGKYKEAESLVERKMMSRPLRQMPYQTVGDLRLAFPKAASVSEYRRDLDIDKAIASVSYKLGDTTFTRQTFSSAVAGAIVIRLTADKPGAISFGAAFQSPEQAGVTREGNTLILSGVNGGAYGIEGKLRFQSRARVIADGGKIGSTCENVKALTEP